jgi:alpha-aminoadipate carrier protein LysW
LKCSECDGDIKIPDDVIEGEIVTCADCGVSFEVHKKRDSSYELIPAQIEGEDWGE